MTSTVERPAPRSAEPVRPAVARRWMWEHAVPVTAAVVVALRLPFVLVAPGADEAGFLMVARQWRPGGGSLYGSYWVDRPPVLISIYRISAQLGGLVPLRVIGALAAALVVVGAARVARQVIETRGGRAEGAASIAARAGRVAALVAAALCVSPLMGAREVNGELLAAPFVVWGVSALLAALHLEQAALGRAGRALAAGAAFAGAVLVKQNFVDVAVFAAAALVIGAARHELSVGRAARVATAFVAGAVLATGLASMWTMLHGTSLSAVYEAMYPFRLAAAKAMAASGNTAPTIRLSHLSAAFVITAVPVLLASAAVALATRRVRDTAAWAMVALLGFDVASILAGGNFWSHYLMQLVVPVAVLSGVVTASAQPGRLRTAARIGVVAVLLSSLLAWAVAAVAGPSPSSKSGWSLGQAVGAVARPDDTIITVYGHADVSESSGLSSPYPYLWSLPLKVRDPHEQLLEQVVSGPEAPTWIVTWAGVGSINVDASRLAPLLHRDYHRVAVLDRHTVYLHDGVDRPVPSLTP